MDQIKNTVQSTQKEDVGAAGTKKKNKMYNGDNTPKCDRKDSNFDSLE